MPSDQPMTNTWSPTTSGEAAPLPVLVFQTGGFSSQSFPFQAEDSLVIPLRSLPRQWGQSSAWEKDALHPKVAAAVSTSRQALLSNKVTQLWFV